MMMCSPSGFIFILIVGLLFNCLHCGVVGVDSSSSSNIGGRLLIDITRKRSVHLNGVEINENSLVNHLEDHERELIFGKSKTNRPVKLVHLRHLADAEVATDTTNTAAAAAERMPHRVKRSDTPTEQQSSRVDGGAQLTQEVSVQIQDNEHLVNLKLHQTPKLIDDAFVYIRRYANSTQFIEDSHKLAEKYERCFYSNENSALDLCDDENVRGVFHHNSTDFIIHPLPSRFGNSTHVILESTNQRPYERDIYPTTLESMSTTLLDSNLQFEPDEEDFNELSIMNMGSSEVEEETSRPTRNSNYMSSKNTNHHSDNIDSYGKSHQIPLHLRYKPRYLHDDHHKRQRKHHHQVQHMKHHQNHQKHQKHHSHEQQQQQQQHHHHHHRQHHQHHQQPKQHTRHRRYISSGSQPKIPQVLHIETAIFVDSDLFKHMAKNFPQNTESHLIRFVLAMINGVQLLYHHSSLGHRVNFVLKRLEILYKDPKDLRRSSDIDTYLSNFCMWQKHLNPPSDKDRVHYDHAVILTGLDLYVVGKNGKVISQVVGLAPVAGMCTPTSSCTINEGKHFESVFVVAHEIGHNLGMRHDTNENSCDPSLYIMSPTLGSGKITWSKCSRTYLNTFLETKQAECLFDRGQFVNNLDHAAEGMLPGERFDANTQCMLKYGKDSERARSQTISDICRDLHCQRDRYTWTSHPALEGTECGENMWCRSGVCVTRPTLAESYSAPKQISNSGKPGYEKASFLESSKMGHLLHEYNYNKLPTWGDWGEASECDSGCLYGPSQRLREGSTGLKTYSRSCLDFRRRCLGRDRKYESCIAKLCYSIAITTIENFATQVCEKAQKFDVELTGEGQQTIGDIEESCKVICKTKSNGTKSRSWTFPDGTTCRSKLYNFDDTSYCIAGRCEKFSCDNATNNYYKIDPKFCQYRQPQQTQSSAEIENRRMNNNLNNNIPNYHRYADRDHTSRDVVGIYAPTTVRSKYENEVAVRNFHGQSHEQPYKRKSDPYQPWNKYNYHLNDQMPAVPQQPQQQQQQQPPLQSKPSPPVSASLISANFESEWMVKSGCHSSCMDKSKGVQVVASRRTGSNNIQLCTHTVKPCERLLTAAEYAENTCARYKLKVRGLSGHGTQIAASIDEPDRSCRVGCQDEYIKYRFYLVNGKYGHFPLGTKCSNTEERYCVNGKCLEFGNDDIPLQQSHISLALFRNRRSIEGENSALNDTRVEVVSRRKRSFLYYEPVNITETITQELINNIVNSIINYEQRHIADDLMSDDHIEFTNPIHISMDELSMK